MNLDGKPEPKGDNSLACEIRHIARSFLKEMEVFYMYEAYLYIFWEI